MQGYDFCEGYHSFYYVLVIWETSSSMEMETYVEVEMETYTVMDLVTFCEYQLGISVAQGKGTYGELENVISCA